MAENIRRTDTPDKQMGKETIRLKELLAPAGRKIVVLAHSNPDGDAIGSALALSALLRELGHEVMCAVPNRYPAFLGWLPGIEYLRIYKLEQETVTAGIEAADIIICVDFNTPARLEALAPVMEANTKATRVLIDHHQQPSPNFDLTFSDPSCSSTCYLLFKIICEIYGEQAITKSMAEALFVGMMTDTGNFSFSNLSPGLYRALAILVEKGVDAPRINTLIYSTFSEGRMRLMGYALYKKMEIVDGRAAYIYLSEEELRRFNFQIGDTEGFVNLPLSVEGVRISAMFVQTKHFIRVSLRSRGEVDVNLFAREYFGGGGHKNAAGGKSVVSMSATIARFRRGLKALSAQTEQYETE